LNSCVSRQVAKDKIIVFDQIIITLINFGYVNYFCIEQRRHAFAHKALHVLNPCVECFDIRRVINTDFDPWRLAWIERMTINAHIKVGKDG